MTATELENSEAHAVKEEANEPFRKGKHKEVRERGQTWAEGL